MSVRQKVKRKCDCGQTVAAGSVFCPYCMAKTQKKNDKMVKRGEKKYHVGGKERRKK